MPVMKGSTSIAANSTNANILQGQDYQFLPWDALCSLYLSESATGLTVDFKATAEALAAGITPNIAQVAGAVQTSQDGIFINEPIPYGKQLKLVVANTTGGALTLNWRVELDQIIRG